MNGVALPLELWHFIEMFKVRKDWEEREARMLAPYAVRSDQSRGRKYDEAEHSSRACFARDRDRILHSRCFRRLEYKTQVFINGTDDHYRTRLTHTMEMAAVGRTLARAFKVNEDLTEAICLAHDIGHSPFGHSGEHELDKLMREHGGFDHNEQSLRWVEFLEPQYPDFNGLNLTWEVRAGLMKHEAAREGGELDGHPIGPFQSIEAQIADIADDISYYAHDVDDGLEAGLLRPAMLKDQPLWQMAEARTDERHTDLSEEQHMRITVRNLLDIQVQDIIQSTYDRLHALKPNSMNEAMNAPLRIVDFTPEMRPRAEHFRAFLYENMYFSPSVVDANNASVKMMHELFHHYISHPESMGRKAQARIKSEGLWRTVCDYVSGFTDRYALEEHERYRL